MGGQETGERVAHEAEGQVLACHLVGNFARQDPVRPALQRGGVYFALRQERGFVQAFPRFAVAVPEVPLAFEHIELAKQLAHLPRDGVQRVILKW